MKTFSKPSDAIKWAKEKLLNHGYVVQTERWQGIPSPDDMWETMNLSPKYAAEEPNSTMFGIRYNYGDFGDVIRLLQREPFTRQAFLPMWFPEDTGSVHGERVPCTIGYHFMRRGNYLHIVYYIRSCDYLRHFRDDIYVACINLMWVLETL